MSEKRLISRDHFLRISNFIPMVSDDLFDELPLPTLENIQGERTLESMTEEEMIELLKIGKAPWESNNMDYRVTKIKSDGNFLWVDYDTVDKDNPHLTGGGHITIAMGRIPSAKSPMQVVKWFIEKGFKVF